MDRNNESRKPMPGIVRTYRRLKGESLGQEFLLRSISRLFIHQPIIRIFGSFSLSKKISMPLQLLKSIVDPRICFLSHPFGDDWCTAIEKSENSID
ncbi:hypothetical protein J6590_069093 [Homalodisca vitripennis]|nr:hypothetical protein J6590_069093 [Homalodisca vitripennis]